MSQSGEYRYWKVAVIMFGLVSLATGAIQIPGFWSSYVLDIVGPAWVYILIRGLFAKRQPAMLSLLLTPTSALSIIVILSFLIEATQYLKLYEACYDPFDFVAYISLVIPCYGIDRYLLKCRITLGDIQNL